MSADQSRGTQHLAWLLGCLDSAVECLDWCGRDIDARIVEAHRVQLAAGREWPGEPVTCPPEFKEPYIRPAEDPHTLVAKALDGSL